MSKNRKKEIKHKTEYVDILCRYIERRIDKNTKKSKLFDDKIIYKEDEEK